LGIYADWSLQDDGTGVLTFTSTNQRPYGQYDELAVWSRALAPEDVAALAAGDEERRSGVDAALALQPSLLYDFSVPADADGAWPNQGAAGARYDAIGGRVATGVDAYTSTYVIDSCTTGTLTMPVFSNATGVWGPVSQDGGFASCGATCGVFDFGGSPDPPSDPPAVLHREIEQVGT
jgi:hypothetical protein